MSHKPTLIPNLVESEFITSQDKIDQHPNEKKTPNR